jgi:membrane-bound serine protease (ClpP class)
VPWWLVVVMVASTLLFYLGGMPIAVRSRFSTPTVGRESLIGELGEAAVAIDPDGVVLIDGARWRARTNRATPIPAGSTIRVVEVLGLVLEVEPEEGGAKDYREMRRGRVGDPEGEAAD